jgi:hypothetical protein
VALVIAAVGLLCFGCTWVLAGAIIAGIAWALVYQNVAIGTYEWRTTSLGGHPTDEGRYWTAEVAFYGVMLVDILFLAVGVGRAVAAFAARQGAKVVGRGVSDAKAGPAPKGPPTARTPLESSEPGHPRYMTDGGDDVPVDATSTKRVPNPDGSRGSPRHSGLADRIAEERSAFYADQPDVIVRREWAITDPLTGEVLRRADVAVLRGKQIIELHQVGLIGKRGNWVMRELRNAGHMYDITGVFPDVHPYGVLKGGR